MEDYAYITALFNDEPLEDLIKKRYDLSSSELAEVEEESGVKVSDIAAENKETIESKYPRENKDDNGGLPSSIVKANTTIKVKDRFSKVARAYVIQRQQQQFEIYGTNNYKAFLGETIEELIGREDYRALLIGKTFKWKREPLQMTVFMYSKVLDRVINITQHLQGITTNVTQTGGNFSLSLPAIRAEYKELDEATIAEGGVSNWVHFEDEDNFYRKSATNKHQNATLGGGVSIDEQTSAQGFYYEKITNSNDIVFIAFERLAVERDERGQRINRDFKKLSDLEGMYFDMIGLVDGVNITRNPSRGDSRITIRGRDLSKLILNDGVYFFPVTEGSDAFLGNYFANIPNNEEDRKSFSRVFGSVADTLLYTEQTISSLIEYIYNKFTNIKILDEKKFDGVGVENRGIFSYVNLVIDDEVGQRKLVDTSISTQSGSTFNFLSKVAQMPFVEFFQDTYGDRFFWIFRKPPFTKKSYLEQFEMVNEGNGIVIKDDEYIDAQLSFDDENAYSWFRLEPKGYFLGSQMAANFALPAVYFPELADIFGNKPLQEVTNYLNYGQNGREDSGKASIGFKTGVKDLKYMVETNVYLPFTRKGSIQVYGDRRIKRGMVIKVLPLKMYFYVDGVQHSAQVNNETTSRLTSIQVSRGMTVKDFGKYFEIIDFGNDGDDVEVGTRKLDWKVNKEVLKYLIDKKNYAPKATI